MIKSSLSKVKIFPSLIITSLFFCCQDVSDPILDKDYGIVINEINYNSSDDFNSGDWIEIYNNEVDTIDISSWSIKDEKDDHIFTIPENTLIAPGSYLIFCSELNLFTTLFPDIENYYGNLGFNLSGRSDAVRIFDNFEHLVDSVGYEDTIPWPINADGEGATLELFHPSRDNSKSNNWGSSIDNGTPGYINSIYNIDG
jgi:hypothetical protein